MCSVNSSMQAEFKYEPTKEKKRNKESELDSDSSALDNNFMSQFVTLGTGCKGGKKSQNGYHFL